MIEKIDDNNIYIYNWRDTHLEFVEKYPESFLAYSYINEDEFKLVAVVRNARSYSRPEIDKLKEELRVCAKAASPIGVVKISTTLLSSYGYLC